MGQTDKAQETMDEMMIDGKKQSEEEDRKQKEEEQKRKATQTPALEIAMEASTDGAQPVQDQTKPSECTDEQPIEATDHAHCELPPDFHALEDTDTDDDGWGWENNQSCRVVEGDDDEDEGTKYGFNTSSVADLNNKMEDDVKIILAEYRLALKKNNAERTK